MSGKLVIKFSPTKVFLVARLNNVGCWSCPLCENDNESTDHLLWSCPVSKELRNLFWSWWSFTPSSIHVDVLNLQNILKVNVNPECKSAWQVSVIALLWSICVGRNECIFRSTSFGKAGVIFKAKCWSFEWCLGANLISSDLRNLWFCDPGAAIISLFKSSQSNFLGKVFSKFKYEAFCDGSWKINEEGHISGGIGGVVLNKKMELVYLFSGPCVAQDAKKVEMLAILHIGVVLEMLNEEYLICMDSKLIEISFLKAKAGIFGSMEDDYILKNIVERCRAMRISYIKREWNLTTDRLAKEGRSREKLVAGWL